LFYLKSNSFSDELGASMFSYRLLTILASFLFLNACAHKTAFTEGKPNDPSAKFCNFVRYELNLDYRNDALKSIPNHKSLGEVLEEGFGEDTSIPIPKDDMLFLSGGSLNGAFGAGVLKGWHEKDGKLPDFSVVTGISTGAILSLAAFTNKPIAAVEGYSLESESEAIEAFVKRDKNGRIKQSAYLTAVRKGALADINPLKESTYKIVAKHDIFPAIAQRETENRKLLTGVVDIDTGEAVALDMTKMARKIMDEVNLLHDPAFKFKTDETIEQLKERAPTVGHYVDCFTSAIAASSSVPLAARPIAIDNRLYIDGGARFLVFSDLIGPLINPRVDFNKNNDDDPVNIYVIINSDQTITPKCKKKECPADLAGYDYWALEGEREDWNVLSLVERTVDILKTQVGEFSESEIRFRVAENVLAKQGIDYHDLVSLQSHAGFKDTDLYDEKQLTMAQEVLDNNDSNYTLKILKIEPETLNHIVDGKTCSQWRDHDEKEGRNLQFHLNYMRCTIDAGKTVITTQGWE